MVGIVGGMKYKQKQEDIKMNLAQALRTKKLLANEINRLKARAIRGSHYTIFVDEHGNKHSNEVYTEQEFNDFLSSIEEKTDELRKIKRAIARANLIEINGETIQDLLIERNLLQEKYNMIQQLSMGTLGHLRNLGSYDDVAYPRISTSETDKQMDEIINKQSEIDMKINQMNGQIMID